MCSAGFSQRTLGGLINLGATELPAPPPDAAGAAADSHADARTAADGGAGSAGSTAGIDESAPPVLVRNASNGSSAVALTLLPETDSRYGVNHVGGAVLEYPGVEVACTTRGCTAYHPSQMWYLSPSGQLQSANYTA